MDTIAITVAVNRCKCFWKNIKLDKKKNTKKKLIKLEINFMSFAQQKQIQ